MNPHADPHDNVSCPGCAQYEEALVKLEGQLEELGLQLINLKLKLQASEAATDLGRWLLDAHRARRVG
jgi:hypothetical protein